MKEIIWKDEPRGGRGLKLSLLIFLGVVGGFVLLFSLFIFILLLCLGEFSVKMLILIIFIILLNIFFLALIVKDKPISVSTEGITFSKIFSRDKIKKEEIDLIIIGKIKDINTLGKMLSYSETPSFILGGLFGRLNLLAQGITADIVVNAYTIKIKTKKGVFSPIVTNVNGCLKALKKIGFNVKKENEVYIYERK